MHTFAALVRWAESHRDWWFDLMRIWLGIGLVVRGVLFFDQPALLQTLVESGAMQFVPTLVAHYVIVAHVAGGALLALGLLTRIAALVQVPILFGAVFLVHLREGLFTSGQNLELAALVLWLLVLIVLHGPGRLSLDHALSPEAAARRRSRAPRRRVRAALRSAMAARGGAAAGGHAHRWTSS